MSSPSSSISARSILSHAKISPYPASRRAHSNAGWLISDRSFNHPDYYSPTFPHFGPIRILNEDRVAPKTGFPTHPHRDAEIFSYILRGELTHRDSTATTTTTTTTTTPGASPTPTIPTDKKLFYRMKWGDVQFTSAGTGVTHSETNEHGSEWVHFLQIWVLPWTQGLKPSYHTESFSDAAKRRGFVTIISPVKGCVNATPAATTAVAGATETACIEGTIPIHADFWFGAAIIPAGERRGWRVAGSGGVVKFKSDRKVYVYLPQTKDGQARIRLNGSEDAVLEEGDGAFVSDVNAGDELVFESIGTEEAEVVVLDANPN